MSATSLDQWRFMLWQLVSKELRVRYKSPALGLLWAVAVPLLTSFVLAVVFGRLMPAHAGSPPYFLFLVTGVFPWSCFQMTVAAATTSLQDNGRLIRQIRFPRQLIPWSIVAANFVNFLIALLVVVGFVWGWGVPVRSSVWWLPCAVILQLILSAGLALAVSAWQAQYRDIKYAVEVTLLLWFYATPILYPASAIASNTWMRYALLANPVAGLVTLYRMALLGWDAAGVPSGISPSALFGWTLAVSLLCACFGWYQFSRRGPTLADVV